MIRLDVLLLVVLGCLSCGCEKPRDNVEDIDVARVCRSYLNAIATPGNRIELGKKLNAAMLLAHTGAREGLVRMMAEELMGTDLSLRNDDYQGLLRRVSAYENCFECVEDCLFSTELDSRYVMKTFFDCADRLRHACMSVPQGGRMQGEDIKMFEKRCYAVWGMMDDYAHFMRLWEVRMPRHLQILPSTLHDEYMEKRKKFLVYASGRELRDRMILNER